jgi:hypothetical protein
VICSCSPAHPNTPLYLLDFGDSKFRFSKSFLVGQILSAFVDLCMLDNAFPDSAIMFDSVLMDDSSFANQKQLLTSVLGGAD